MDDNGNVLRLSDSPVRLTEAYEARIKELEQKLLALLSPSQPAS
jgi:hypothetical protein